MRQTRLFILLAGVHVAVRTRGPQPQMCLAHAPQQSEYPQGEKAKLKFESHHFEFPFDFYLVADFECFLKPPNEDFESQQQQVIHNHVPSDKKITQPKYNSLPPSLKRYAGNCNKKQVAAVADQPRDVLHHARCVVNKGGCSV